jgi:hypothetical protein
MTLSVVRIDCYFIRVIYLYRSEAPLCVHDRIERRDVCTRDSGLPLRPFDQRFIHDVRASEPSLSFLISPKIRVHSSTSASLANLLVTFFLLRTVGEM